MVSDEALMLEFQRGSRAAFEELFERYREPFYGFFRRPLSNPERGEDLTQETFIAVTCGAARYEPRCPFRSYLYGIALKIIAAERRKFARESNYGSVDGEPVTGGSPSDFLWVRQAIEKLDPTEQGILMLREYEQLSYAEIAELLRVPLNTVRTKLFRSRTALKRHLESHSEQSVGSGGGECL